MEKEGFSKFQARDGVGKRQKLSIKEKDAGKGLMECGPLGEATMGSRKGMVRKIRELV